MQKTPDLESGIETVVGGGAVGPIITGWGLMTPWGALAETWSALLAGRRLGDHGRVPAEYLGASAEPADDSDLSVGSSRVGRLACVAAAAACSGVPAGVLASPDTALVVGTSKGPVDDWLGPAQTTRPNPRLAPPADHPFFNDENQDADQDADVTAGGSRPRVHPAGVGEIARHVGGRFRIGGPRLTVPAACASGLHALVRGTMLIRGGQARRVLVVAAESSLHPLFLATFARLGVLAPPGFGCRPFDRSRQGFLLSEAAAAVFLEARAPDDPPGRRLESGGRMPSHGGPRAVAVASPSPSDDSLETLPRRGPAGVALGSPPPPAPRVRVERFALGGDATHLTGGDPQARTLRRLLSRVIAGRPVDMIHAHATGTVAHDPVELAAIEACVADALPGRPDGCRDADGRRPAAESSPPAVYSHKGAIGHSLGAAGLVAVVLNCQSHATGLVPGNVRTTDPLPAAGLDISPSPVARSIRRSIALASGFGGAAAVVSLTVGESERTNEKE